MFYEHFSVFFLSKNYHKNSFNFLEGIWWRIFVKNPPAALAMYSLNTNLTINYAMETFCCMVFFEKFNNNFQVVFVLKFLTLVSHWMIGYLFKNNVTFKDTVGVLVLVWNAYKKMLLLLLKKSTFLKGLDSFCSFCQFGLLFNFFVGQNGFLDSQ